MVHAVFLLLSLSDPLKYHAVHPGRLHISRAWSLLFIGITLRLLTALAKELDPKQRSVDKQNINPWMKWFLIYFATYRCGEWIRATYTRIKQIAFPSVASFRSSENWWPVGFILISLKWYLLNGENFRLETHSPTASAHVLLRSVWIPEWMKSSILDTGGFQISHKPRKRELCLRTCLVLQNFNLTFRGEGVY